MLIISLLVKLAANILKILHIAIDAGVILRVFSNFACTKWSLFMEGRLWISDNKASLLEIETGRDASDR